MGEKAALIEAAKAIGKVLKGFVLDNESRNIHYFESSPGHVRFLVGSDRFKGVGPAERQDMIWEHLERRVPPDQLSFCLGVHTMDVAEFTEATFPEASSGSVPMFTEDSASVGEDSDE